MFAFDFATSGNLYCVVLEHVRYFNQLLVRTTDWYAGGVSKDRKVHLCGPMLLHPKYSKITGIRVIRVIREGEVKC